MPCQKCIARGKIWEGSDPKCAFETEIFSVDNWGCATLIELRQIAESFNQVYWTDNQNACMFAVPDEGVHIVLSWYKSRGTTEAAWIIDPNNGTIPKPLDLKTAEKILNKIQEP